MKIKFGQAYAQTKADVTAKSLRTHHSIITYCFKDHIRKVEACDKGYKTVVVSDLHPPIVKFFSNLAELKLTLTINHL